MFTRPNSTDSECLLADFLELECLISGGAVSSLSYRSLLTVADDELDNEGIESADDKATEMLDVAVAECSKRSQFCNGRYPFEIGVSSLMLKSNLPYFMEVYKFLLLITRMNMQTHRCFSGYDATSLFEELCACVAREYYGPRSQVKVFGTSVSGTFEKKICNLLKSLNIKGNFKRPVGSTGREKDGSLDLVAWIPFADKREGQMIALGQCKTGTTWEQMLSDLEPRVFFASYSTEQPFASPVKMFFVSEFFEDYKWEERCRKGGVLFDRTRIMEYLPNEINADLLTRIKEWNASAMETVRTRGREYSF